MHRYSAFTGLRCVSCGLTYAPDELLYVCPECGPLAGTLDVRYDLEWLSAHFGPGVLRQRDDRTLRRYHELLPIRDPGACLDLPVGMTPLWKVPEGVRERLGRGPATARDDVATARGEAAAATASALPVRLWIKDDTRHPSGSAKDRATMMALGRARELGVDLIAAASTGNAASSLAALSAAAGIGCIIFAPASAPEAKLVQIRIHGARLFAVEGTYDEAFDLCWELCRRTGIYNRNTAVNPVLGEGKKTIALEIWEQLGFRAPDAVVVPVGDGCILGGVAKGFRDLLDLEWIERMPRLIGVQAEGSAALANAWRDGAALCAPVEAATVADSISVAQPRDQVKALRGVRESGGAFVVVSDAAILSALSDLAAQAGLFVEPAAAAAFAGLRQGMADGRIREDEEVVLVLTGHGLKDVGAARRAAEQNPPIPVPPRIDEVERLVRLREDGWKR